jgi:putative CocE/NonD family hydrolase
MKISAVVTLLAKCIGVLCVLFVLALTDIAGFLPRTRRQAGSPQSSARQTDVSIPMRDGVVLRADILSPSATGRFPALVYRTPYGKEFAQKEYKTFEKALARGYAVVIQDVRGRYASDGEFNAYRDEGRDGYDTIEWVARQPWCDGNVGTFGLSYPGAVQWLAAVENPPHLKAMVPAMTFATPRNFFYSGGVFDLSWIDWIWLNIAPDVRRRKGFSGPKTYEEARESWKKERDRLLNFLPLAELTDFNAIAPYYYEWLNYAPADPWWDWAELRNKYNRVHAAVLNLSGWYDEAYGPDGATTNFNGLLASRKDEKDPRTHTIIGPWTHGGQQETHAGERQFGPAAAIDYDELILRWMDHYLRGIDNGVEREKRVRLFVMGQNVWRDEDAWPLQRAAQQTYYLRSESNSARFARLNPTPPDRAGYNEFISDPLHPLTDPYTGYGAHDYQKLAGRKDVLVYDTDPLSSDMEVTGPIRAEIFASADTPDVDLWVRLLDVAPDGTAFNLMSPGADVLRASYRNSKPKPEMLEPGQIYQLDLNRMLTSNTFLAGHRIRVQISGAFFPHFSRNLQSEESEITGEASCVARIRIHHDKDHASRIILPVIPR